MTVMISTHNEAIPEAKIIDAGLDAFNASAAPLDQVRPLICLAQSSDGTVIGGVIGRTWGACCEMLRLWVQEDHRGQGIGRRLVTKFHGEGEQRGCRTFYLDTFTFQAPDFYRKFGYEVRLELRGYAPEIARYIMVRER